MHVGVYHEAVYAGRSFYAQYAAPGILHLKSCMCIGNTSVHRFAPNVRGLFRSVLTSLSCGEAKVT